MIKTLIPIYIHIYSVYINHRSSSFGIGSLVSSVNASTEKLPPPESPFCDEPHPGGCYDRNDNPEEYCVKYDDPSLCKVINICDENGSVKPIDEYCKTH